ncbi:12877_t:CDS:2 [Funneliformis geosporum]|uniref:16212_t:CDS:1 n=1 Tax=Funneliformis geosporum TaxID=1117311 RepID=A0A9W4T1F8_9GLOM|nr:16212_t:CDS:2 [Funneliformis geosporum]CAI2192869.1 12877_t:CDS:2 [Funneliformis geosporum]
MKVTSIVAFSITLLASIVDSQKACNGYAELCDKLYSEIAYVTTHNSYAAGKQPAANQNFNVSVQLKDGVRGLMLDSVFPDDNPKEMHLCHGNCRLLDAGPAVNTLTTIADWLNENPNEVVTIIWENTANVPTSAFNDVYTQSGLGKFGHVQEVGKGWPSLSKMIDSGKRLVNFINPPSDGSIPMLMSEFEYVFETPFENENQNGFKCTVDRPKGKEQPLYVLNHFLYNNLIPMDNQIQLPQPGLANITNSASLADHAKQCQQTFNKIPNFIAVDFYDKGSNDGQNVFSIVAELNNVKYTQTQIGDGTTNGGNTDNGKVKKNAAQPSVLRNFNALIGLASVSTWAMFVL